MSNDLVLKEYTPEQMKLITDVVAKGATPDELQLFLYRCKNLGLDPLKSGQIYFVKYGSNPGTIVVGIDGFRSKASRTGKLAGIKRGIIRNDKGVVSGAWAEVYRSDWREPAREEVSLAEYNTGRAMWAKMPETMIKKVAEAAALRMAFPDDLGGTYVTEEMDQAAPKPGQILIEQPGPEDGIQTNDYSIPFGKYKNRTLEEVGPTDLESYVNYLEAKAEKDGKQITGVVADFIQRAIEYVVAFQTKQQEPTQEVFQ